MAAGAVEGGAGEARGAARRVDSTIGSLKELITIVTGVTLVAAIDQLLTESGSQHYGGWPFLTTLALFVLLSLNLLRFYHGNVRLLDERYGRAATSNTAAGSGLGGRIAADFFAIFVECAILASCAFFIHDSEIYSYLFELLLGVDVLWAFVQTSSKPLERDMVHQRSWLFNNTACLIAFLILHWLALPLAGQTIFNSLVVAVWFVNTGVDLRVSWPLYFPGSD